MWAKCDQWPNSYNSTLTSLYSVSCGGLHRPSFHLNWWATIHGSACPSIMSEEALWLSRTGDRMSCLAPAVMQGPVDVLTSSPYRKKTKPKNTKTPSTPQHQELRTTQRLSLHQRTIFWSTKWIEKRERDLLLAVAVCFIPERSKLGSLELLLRVLFITPGVTHERGNHQLDPVKLSTFLFRSMASRGNHHVGAFLYQYITQCKYWWLLTLFNLKIRTLSYVCLHYSLCRVNVLMIIHMKVIFMLLSIINQYR